MTIDKGSPAWTQKRKATMSLLNLKGVNAVEVGFHMRVCVLIWGYPALLRLGLNF